MLLFALAGLSACHTAQKTPLYDSYRFKVFPDKVVQGVHEAKIISPTEIRSNYQSPANATFSRLITFKISINEKDNELPPGKDHWVVIGDEHESPLIVFGSPPPPPPPPPTTFLPVNYEYTFMVDMTPVIKQFNEKGYYEAYDGTRVAKADFKGFYVAGGAEPLSWDFVNLDNKGLKLIDSGVNNIHILRVFLNPYDDELETEKTWKLSADISKRPQYHSDQPIVDALFNLSLEEATKNIEKDSTFRTGAKWGGVWTRDVSYSTLLAFAYHEPEVAKTSLRKKVKRNRIIQDTGSGGAWPVSSDRTTWALAAWEIYKATGDRNWLAEAFQVIKNSADDDEKTLFDPQTGMYCGESSFLDWREQTYPKWMSNMDIYVSLNLGTNVVHYQTHRILAEMAKILGEPYQAYVFKAETIKAGINKHLWMPDKGYYAQYLYGRPNLTVSPRFEALGEALAVLFDVADPVRAKTIVSKSPVTEYGVTCIFPQIPGIPPYHNDAIWPFVQSYWNLAAAKAGNEEALNRGLAAIYRAGALFLTNYENFVAGTGDFDGTEINSDRMLWSMAGNLAMVHRVFMGMSFEADGIRFQPVVPKTYPGKKTLSNFHYRNATLHITVNGFGNQIKTILLDGKPLKDAFLPANLTGVHSIDIQLKNNDFSDQRVNWLPNFFTLPAPQARREGNLLKWDAVKDAKHYRVYKNGQYLGNTAKTEMEVSPIDGQFCEYKVSAVEEILFPVGELIAEEYVTESFTSEPVVFTDASAVKIFEMETFAPASKLPYSNFSGGGFVEISTATNRRIECRIKVETAGEYLLNVHYSNGSGPWNTDNKCAIRSLTVNGSYAGVLVFPQRGKDEWSDWGFSNSRSVSLQQGENLVVISFEDWNNNMSVDVNTAMLDYLSVVRK
ncbi:MAG: glycogen debranching protein [Saprospiraceae bacterium]|nr:glycogen debranching protein [Saprospiraceae bacterium]